jgi:hypothetical protein
LKGIALVIVFEGILSPALDIIKASLAWQECNPNLLTKLSLMKLCVSLWSNKILMGWPWIEKVPVNTAAPSGMSIKWWRSVCPAWLAPWVSCHNYLVGPWAFTLLVLLGFGALTDIVSWLPTIIAAMVLSSIIVSWGCSRLVGLLLCLTVLEILRRLVLRQGHPLVSSWRWPGRTMSTLLDKAELFAWPTSSVESGLPLTILLGFCHGIFLRNCLVHKVLIVVRLIKIKPLIKVSV